MDFLRRKSRIPIPDDRRRRYDGVDSYSNPPTTWGPDMGIVTQGVSVPLSLGLHTFNASCNTASGMLSRLTRAANITLKLGGIAGGAGVVGVGAGLAKAAADWEQSMAKLRRAADMPAEGFRRLQTDFKRFVSGVSGVKLDSAFEIATIGAKLGIAGDALNLFTRDISKLRVAIDEQDLPTEEMTNRLAGLVSVFQRGTHETIRFGAALNKLDLMSTASARDILDISSRMSGTAATLGMSPQKTMALAAAMRQAQIPVEVGGSSMTQVMSKMAAKKTAPAFARVAGMGEKDFLATLTRDPLEAIKAIEKGLRGMEKLQAVRTLDQLGLTGVRTRQTLLQLGTVLPQLDEFVRASEEEWSSLNSLMKSNATMGGTLHAQWTKLANNFRLTASSLGEAMLPALKGLSEGLVNLMHDIRESIDKNKDVFMKWGNRIGSMLSNVGAMWRNFPLYVDYAKVVIAEKFGQISEVFRRFATLGKHYIQEFGKDIMAYFADIGDNIVKTIDNSIDKMMGKQPRWKNIKAPELGDHETLPIGQRVRRAAAKEDPFDQQAAGRRVGFMENLQGLPGMKVAKGVAWGRIAAANLVVRDEAAARKQQDEAADAKARADAEARRAEALRPKPGPGRKPLDVGRAAQRNLPLGESLRLAGLRFQGQQAAKIMDAQTQARQQAALALAKAFGDQQAARQAALNPRMAGRNGAVGKTPLRVASPVGGAIAAAMGIGPWKGKSKASQRMARIHKQRADRKQAIFNKRHGIRPVAPMGGREAPEPVKEPIDEAVSVLKAIEATNGKLETLLASIDSGVRMIGVMG